MAYSKLHSSIVNSSLWGESDSTRLLFITLLALSDRDGIVYGTKYGIGRVANIAPDDIDSAWENLMSPDADSSDKMRAPEHEGRRVVEVSGGFQLLNHEYYRGLRNDDDRRDQNRAAQARFKAKVSHDKPPKATTSRRKPPKAHTEADTDTESVPIHCAVAQEGGAAITSGPKCDFRPAAAPPEVTPPVPRTPLTSSPRPRNELFDIMCRVCGIDSSGATRSEYGRVAKALSEIKSVTPSLTPDEITRRVANYRAHYPKASVTPTAISANWSKLNHHPNMVDQLVPKPKILSDPSSMY